MPFFPPLLWAIQTLEIGQTEMARRKGKLGQANNKNHQTRLRLDELDGSIMLGKRTLKLEGKQR